MSSWRLFTYLTPFGWPRLHRAIWQQEQKRTSGWGLARLWLRVRPYTTLFFVLVVLVYAASWCLAPWTGYTRPAVIPWPVLCMLVVPVIILPSLALWIVPLGVTIGSSIARERMNHTWDVLRLIPIDRDDILLTKVHAALWPLYPAIRLWRVVLLLAALAPATLSLNLLDSLTLTYTTTHAEICGAGIAFLVAGAIIFVLDRMQQFTLMGVAALAASAAARSTQRGIMLATLAAGIAWLVDVGVAVVALATLPRWVTLGVISRSAMLVMLGPAGGYLAELHIHEAVVFIAGTFIVRELAIRALWWWSVRAAG